MNFDAHIPWVLHENPDSDFQKNYSLLQRIFSNLVPQMNLQDYMFCSIPQVINKPAPIIMFIKAYIDVL